MGRSGRLDRRLLDDRGQHLGALVAHHNQVLDAHAETTGQVDARLDRDDHSGSQRTVVRGRAHARHLVHVEPDTVAEFDHGDATETSGSLSGRIAAGSLSAQELLEAYCAQLYERTGNYAEVARRTGLDRRTVRKYARARSSDAE